MFILHFSDRNTLTAIAGRSGFGYRLLHQGVDESLVLCLFSAIIVFSVSELKEFHQPLNYMLYEICLVQRHSYIGNSSLEP